MTEKVLIAGGLGFIGSNLIKKLLELKYQVFCIDRNISIDGIAYPFLKNIKVLLLIKSNILKTGM